MTNTQINLNKKLKLNFFLLLGACIAAAFIAGPDINSMPFGQWIASCLFIGLFALFPLLFFIPSVLKPNPRNISWLGFFLLAYLVVVIWVMFLPGAFLAGFLVLVFSITTFFYVVMWLRPFKQEAKKRKKEQD